MRYLGSTVVGLGLIAAACTVIAYVSYLIVQIGTCAGGPQPFEIQRACPEGTTGVIVAMFAAFPVLGLGGLLHSQRGRAPGSEREPATITLLVVWCGLFGALAFASLWGVWGPDADPGGYTDMAGATKPAAIGTGVLFSLMAIGGLVPLAKRLTRRAPETAPAHGAAPGSFEVPASRPPRTPTSEAASPSPGSRTLGDLIEEVTGEQGAGGGPVEKLERLDRLRRSGALSEPEFEQMKREIIEGDR